MIGKCTFEKDQYRAPKCSRYAESLVWLTEFNNLRINIARPTRGAMHVEQDQGIAKIPLADISVLVIDQPQVTITEQLLSTLAAAQIATITVGGDQCPNGVLLHSGALKMMQAQLALSVPS